MTEFDREQAAKVLAESYTSENSLSEELPFDALSVRLRNLMRQMNTNTWDDLVSKSEVDLLREPNFGRRLITETKALLATKGLNLASWNNETKSYIKSQVARAAIVYETHDCPEEIRGNLLPPGAVYYFTDSKSAVQFAKVAADIFKGSDGEHKESGELKPDYHYAVQRLPSTNAADEVSEEQSRDKTYPVFVSDAALKALSLAKSVPLLQAALQTSAPQQARC